MSSPSASDSTGETNPDIRIAAVMTCFNRSAATVACIEHLLGQTGDGFDIQVFLTDDGSSDGTSDAVAARFPDVTILEGDGSLYWVGGTHRSDAAAWVTRPDYLLWVNDDVILQPDAVQALLDTAIAPSTQGPAGAPIVVGAMVDQRDGTISYSGKRRLESWHPLRFETIDPTGHPEPVDAMNGNLVLIPRHARETLGPIDNTFSHNMGDLDYGLRAGAAGIGVWLAPQPVGSCEMNDDKATFAPIGGSVRERLRAATSVKAFPPMEWSAYTRRHAGWFWPFAWVWPYIKAVLPQRH